MTTGTTTNAIPATDTTTVTAAAPVTPAMAVPEATTTNVVPNAVTDVVKEAVPTLTAVEPKAAVETKTPTQVTPKEETVTLTKEQLTNVIDRGIQNYEAQKAGVAAAQAAAKEASKDSGTVASQLAQAAINQPKETAATKVTPKSPTDIVNAERPKSHAQKVVTQAENAQTVQVNC